MLLNKNIPITKIKWESSTRSQAFYQKFTRLEYTPSEKSSTIERPQIHTQKSKSSNIEIQAKALLNVWLNQKCPFMIQSEIFQSAGIKSGSAQITIKKFLLRQNLIKEHKIQMGKSYVCILEPLKAAYENIGITQPSTASKGGYLHSLIVHNIMQWANKHGYMADTEFMLSNGKAVDVLLRSTIEIIMCEVAISKPFSKEITNCLKDVASEIKPTAIWIIAQNKKSKIEIDRLLESEISLSLKEIAIITKLAGEFLNYSSPSKTNK